MKKLLAFILAAVMTASLCACGSSKGGAEGSTSAKGSSAAGEAVAASDIKVGCIMIGDENEGYTEAHLKAVEEMKKNLGLSDDQVVIKTNIKEDEGCYDAAVDLAEQGCNIVIANSFGHESYILQAAADYPDVQFCHATGYQAKSSGLSNMHNFFTRIYESRYLSGVVAGMKLNEMIKNGEVSKDKCKIGYVGAFPYAEVISGFTSFYLGVKSVCDSATMEVKYTNSWASFDLEKECAEQLIADGCVLISQHADTTGAPTACEAKKVPCVGYNIDMIPTAPDAALTSATINWGPYYTYAVQSVIDGTAIETDWAKGVKDGADAITELNDKTVAEGTKEAVEEAQRCLGCKNAKCITGCPVNINIPAFIAQVKEGNFEEAYKIIGESSALPAVCGRVCPQESQCEGKCVRGIKGDAVSIGKLERFVADWAKENGIKPVPAAEKNGHKIAVIGSGPAGLTCAGDLAKLGYDVTIFEALHKAGGVLSYGIPEFRLPKDKVVAAEIENVKSLGVKIETNVIIGKSVTIDELLKDEGFEAVFIGSGAGLPMFMGIPGENANGVFSANEFLTRNNLMKAFRDDYDTPIAHGKKVAVVGGGNVAMDAARTALRLGAEVHVIYRRSEAELPARAEEVHHAKEEGIIFDLLTNPVEILTDDKDWVTGIRCIRMELGEPDASGRRRPVEIPGSEFEIEVDEVIMSLGTSPNPLISSTTYGLDVNRRKCIVAEEETGKTSKEGVYAGGDAVTGAATVILAMGAGKAGAKGIDEYIKSKNA